MQALYLSGYGSATDKSDVWHVGPLPKPTLTKPHDVLIRVVAASLNPIDFKLARGDLRLLGSLSFPLQVGFDVSGVVEAVGAAVREFRAGDAVISRVSQEQMGSCAEFVLASDDNLAKKPHNLSHVEAACLPLAGQTALQALRLLGSEKRPAPRSVFIPAALGGVGSLGLQLAHHHFHVEQIHTAVSTAKLPLTRHLFPFAQTVDYKKQEPAQALNGQIDMVFDTTGEAAAYAPMLKRVDESAAAAAAAASPSAKSSLVSIAASPSPSAAVHLNGERPIPWLVRQILKFKEWRLRSAVAKQNALYEYYVLSSNAADLNLLVQLAEAGHLQPLVGKVFSLQAGRAAFAAAENSSAITGKVVIQVAKDGDDEPPQDAQGTVPARTRAIDAEAKAAAAAATAAAPAEVRASAAAPSDAEAASEAQKI